MKTNKKMVNLMMSWLGIMLCLALVLPAGVVSTAGKVWADDGAEQPAQISQEIQVGPSEPISFPPLETPKDRAVIGLSYDDSTAEDANAWDPGIGARYAVRFTPPSYPAVIDTATIGLYPNWPDTDHEQFGVSVFDDNGPSGAPGTQVGSGILTTATSFGWWTVDFSGQNITFPSGDFYIVYEQLSTYPNCEGVALDTSSNAGRSWDYNGVSWSQNTGNRMIRCTVQVATAHWTYLVYLDGDNNLEGAAIGDFLEMASVGSNADVNIVAQFDRISGQDSSYGDWTDCKRFYITSGMTPTSANALQDLGEVNMGAQSTLTDFINWAKTNYPAPNYALVLWNHGGGWRQEALEGNDKTKIEEQTNEPKDDPIFKAVCWDDTSSGDCLYMSEVKGSLAATGGANLIGFDACLMSMVEVAYQVRNYGAVMVTSEETEPGDGWPHDTILADLAANPSWTPAQLGTDIVNRYYASYGNSETQAAVDLSTMNTLASTVSSFAQTMINDHNNQIAVKNAAQSVMNQINASVIAEHHGSAWPGSHGLAIYFPETSGSFNSAYNGTTIDFPGATVWDEFLSDYYASMAGTWIQSARADSQEYTYPEHIDLYDFCQKLVDYTPINVIYTESSVANGFLGSGTAQGWNGDDGSWSYTLPFSFPLYGRSYSQVWICSNGFLDFTDSSPNYLNSDSALMARKMIAPLWDDLKTNGSAQSGEDIYIHQPSPDSVCIRWRAQTFTGSYPVNVEAILYQDGRIKFNYGDGNTNLTPTIGISIGNSTNFDMAQYNGYTTLTNVNSVLFTPSAGTIQKLVGTDTSSTATVSPNYIQLSKFTATATGIISQIRVYSAGSGHVKVAIYQDSGGQPGALMNANSNDNTVLPNQWNNISIADTSVMSGTAYWLGAIMDASSVTKVTATNPRRYMVQTYSGFSWPGTLTGLSASDNMYLCIAAWGVAPLNINTVSLPDGQVGVPYSQTLQASGGSGSYTWSIPSGSLPNGLNLNTSTGVISGTPTTTGTSNFTVQVDDGSNTDNQPLAINVTPLMQKLVGTDTSSTATVSPGYIQLSKFTASTTGIISQIRVYSAGSGHVKVAIYQDSGGQPGALMNANSNDNTVLPNQWNNISIADTSVMSSTAYWLGAIMDSSSVTKVTATNPRRYKVQTYSGFSWPGTLTGLSASDNMYLCIAAWGTTATTPPAAPSLLSPGTSITFKWGASTGATTYQLQVNTASNFTGTDLFNAEVGNVTSQEVTGLSLGTTYYWRVRAGNAIGWSDWSSIRSVVSNTIP